MRQYSSASRKCDCTDSHDQRAYTSSWRTVALARTHRAMAAQHRLSLQRANFAERERRGKRGVFLSEPSVELILEHPRFHEQEYRADLVFDACPAQGRP